MLRRDADFLPAAPETFVAFLAYEAAAASSHRSALRRRPARSPVSEATNLHGSAPRPTAPTTADRIIALAPRTGTDLTALRDRALLLLGFAGAFRRSELVALDLGDIEVASEGLRVTVGQKRSGRKW